MIEKGSRVKQNPSLAQEMRLNWKPFLFMILVIVDISVLRVLTRKHRGNDLSIASAMLNALSPQRSKYLSANSFEYPSLKSFSTMN